MSVERIMTKRLVTVEMDDLLKVVNELFANSKFHHLLVVESGKLVGIVSDRDLLKAISPNVGSAVATTKDLATLNKRVHQIMSRNPVVLKSGADVFDAVEIFKNHAVSCIPVVDNEDRPVGIISWRDIIKAMKPKQERPPGKPAEPMR